MDHGLAKGSATISTQSASAASMNAAGSNAVAAQQGIEAIAEKAGNFGFGLGNIAAKLIGNNEESRAKKSEKQPVEPVAIKVDVEQRVGSFAKHHEDFFQFKTKSNTSAEKKAFLKAFKDACKSTAAESEYKQQYIVLDALEILQENDIIISIDPDMKGPDFRVSKENDKELASISLPISITAQGKVISNQHISHALTHVVQFYKGLDISRLEACKTSLRNLASEAKDCARSLTTKTKDAFTAKCESILTAVSGVFGDQSAAGVQANALEQTSNYISAVFSDRQKHQGQMNNAYQAHVKDLKDRGAPQRFVDAAGEYSKKLASMEDEAYINETPGGILTAAQCEIRNTNNKQQTKS